MSQRTSPFTQARKRDGRVVPFDPSRITNAVRHAMAACGEGNVEIDPQRVSDAALAALAQRFPGGHVPQVEEIQDLVEESLILLDFPKTAKAYILYRHERAKIRDKVKDVPAHVKARAAESKKYFRNPLAEFVYYRTYSRWIEDEGRRETWIETVDRYLDFMREKIGDKLHAAEYAEMREAILTQQIMPSMRLMWSAGKAARHNSVAAYNCSFIAPSKLDDFAEIMFLLMCGVGVGFSVESQNVQLLPIIKRQSGHMLPAHVVDDSKEGWGDALKVGLGAWYEGRDVRFDYAQVRPAGARLHTMGGRSSGPAPLRALLEFARVKILAHQGKRLANLDVHDIICKIGEVVEMGGVRRSALISLSDFDDNELRQAKSGHFYINNPQRSMANNSAVYESRPRAVDFLDEWLALAKSGSGERGLFNRGGLPEQLPARRWKTFQPYWPRCGVNPCVTEDTWVMTSDGARQVRQLIGVPFVAMVDGTLYPSDGFFHTGVQEVFEVRTNRGFSFHATAKHKALTVSYRSPKIQRNAWKSVEELRSGDKIVLHRHVNAVWDGSGSEEEGWLLGSLIGDGNIEKSGKANLDFWGVTQDYMMKRAVSFVHGAFSARSDFVGHVAKTGYARVRSVRLGELALSYGLSNGHKRITHKIEESSSAFYIGFLRGWFDADGSVQGHQGKGVSVRLCSASEESLEAAQRMLARLGVMSTLYRERKSAALRLMPDGKGGSRPYPCQAWHDLVVSGANIQVFAERIHFSDPEKREKLDSLLTQYRRRLNRERFSAEITEITPVGAKPVFDCQVANANAFDGNGVFLHNCGEIVLRSKQFCNLTEVVARADDTLETLRNKMRLATILGTYQSTLTDFPYIGSDWKANCEEERLLGVSITGQWDCPVVREAAVLRQLRDFAIEVNREYAARFGINASTAITCVKPSGTVSQLVDSASGMHPRYAKFYLRRIRISATDPLLAMLREQKFPCQPEVGQLESSATSFVLEFPVAAPPGSTTRTDLDAIAQLEFWKRVKLNYTEHNPSVTVLVAEDEWIASAHWLYDNWNLLGGLSFLPQSNSVYELAPYEEISEEEYRRRVANQPPVDFSHIVAYEKEDTTMGAKEFACVAGQCELDPEEGSVAVSAGR
ncbi:MAG: ATP cone domain-containing protein [Burkholderiales bacterium]